MEQLHGAVNAAVRDENDAQELLSRFRNIMEAATHVADTLCQGNPEMGPLMIQELDRMEQMLAHRAISETATQSGGDISRHSTAMLEEISRHMDKSKRILEELAPHDPLQWQNGDRWKKALTEMSAGEIWQADMAACGQPR